MQTKIAHLLSGKTENIYRSVLAGIDDYSKPHEFVQQVYEQYEHSYQSKSAINGRMFEFIICETLKREGIMPFYYQAKFKLVPNVKFDLVFYDPLAPVVLSAKVSLRERYKQAVLEGFILSQVYRNAKTYLITLNKREQVIGRRKIKSGDVAGLVDCLRADSPDYDDLLEKLKRETFSLAEEIIPIEGRSIP